MLAVCVCVSVCLSASAEPLLHARRIRFLFHYFVFLKISIDFFLPISIFLSLGH